MSIELADTTLIKYTGSGSFSEDYDGIHLSNYIYLKGEYIPITPTGYTFRYDTVISISAGNRFYLGFERYDENKTARSNDACVYPIGFTPSSDVIYRRYRGTVDLSTDGVNPAAFIRLRLLNLWSGSTAETGTASIHSLSLLGVANGESISKKVYYNGIFVSDHFREFEKSWTTNGVDSQIGKVSIAKNGYTDSVELYEF